MSTEIAKPPQNTFTLRDHITSESMRLTLEQSLPKHCTPDRMIRATLTALTRTPKLAECDQKSFFQCMLQLSQWGLEPDGRRAHLIPFRNNRKNITECQLIIDYKGLVELAYRTGTVSFIHADIVCEHDDFLYDRGELRKHQINFAEDRGKMFAAYALIRMKDGTEKCEVLSSAEVDAVRKRSMASSSGPWVTDYNEMAKKTAFRRASKWIPLSADVMAVIENDFDSIQETTTKRHATVSSVNAMLESAPQEATDGELFPSGPEGVGQ